MVLVSSATCRQPQDRASGLICEVPESTVISIQAILYVSLQKV
jgi:hypothetical protein